MAKLEGRSLTKKKKKILKKTEDKAPQKEGNLGQTSKSVDANEK